MLASAPAARRRFTIGRWPFRAAQWRGVEPELLRAEIMGELLAEIGGGGSGVEADAESWVGFGSEAGEEVEVEDWLGSMERR